MNKSTKIFIKDNIDLIESNNWKELFKQAIYNEKDFTTVEELTEVLNESGINYLSYFFQFLNMNLFSYKDILEVLALFHHTYAKPAYSGGLEAGSWASDVTGEGDLARMEDIKNLAKDLGFQVYETNNGGYHSFDYAIIAPYSSLSKFIDDLSWEDDSVTSDQFKKV